MEGKEVIGGQEDNDEGKAQDIPLEQRIKSEGDDAEQEKEMEESKYHGAWRDLQELEAPLEIIFSIQKEILSYSSIRRMEMMVMFSLGTSGTPYLVIVFVLAMASTTSIPLITLPNTG